MICPDRPGLVSELSGWIAKNEGNIRHADHHTDAGAKLFLSRIEWELEGFALQRESISSAVTTLADDLDGNAQTINFPNGKTYLDVASTADPCERFRTASIADYTFICNREKVVAMDSATSPSFGTKSMVFIKAANYSTTYSINLNGTTKTYETNPAGGKEIAGSYSQSGTTVTVTSNGHGLSNGDVISMTFPSGETDDVGDGVAGSYTVANSQTNTFTYTAAQSQTTSGDRCNVIHDPALSTIDIADDLATQLNAISGFTVTNNDYIIRITKDDGGDYTLLSSDTSTGEITKAIKGTMDDLSDLPVDTLEKNVTETDDEDNSGCLSFGLATQHPMLCRLQSLEEETFSFNPSKPGV